MRPEQWARYGTHQEALAWAAGWVGPGPVFEIGCGWWSTPWLHGWCEATERTLYSFESDDKWRRLMAGLYAAPGHIFGAELNLSHVALALVDGDATARGAWALHLRDKGAVVVLHDTEALEQYPGLEEAMSMYENQRVFDRLIPNTTVVW